MREIVMYSVPLLLLGVIGFGSCYLSRRLAWAFGWSPRITLLIVVVVIVLSMVAMMTIMRGNHTWVISHIISNVTNITLGVAMFLTCSLIMVDLAQLFLKMPPRSFGVAVVALTAILSIYSLWNAQHIRVYHRDITIPNLAEPLRIAHLTDIHLGHFWGEKSLRRVVDIVKGQDVDFVVITGDMFDGRVRLNEEAIAPFKELSVPIYFVEGNHDGYSGSGDIKALLKSRGIEVLANELIEYKSLQIIGLDYLTPDKQSGDMFHAPPSRFTMQQVLPTLGVDRSRASIVLHHNPVGANYMSENGINLYLAGHTHAGQLFPATLVAAMMFEFNKGLYRYDDTLQIYVSQGIGTFGPPMRLGTHSELTIIDLKRE